MQSFLTVAFDTSTHFLRKIHGAEDPIEEDIAGVGAFGAGVTASSAAKVS